MRKSADAHAQAGHHVHVLYFYTTPWADQADQVILNQAQWTSEMVGGHPEKAPLRYFFSRLNRKVQELLGNSKQSMCRSMMELLTKVWAWNPDLVIGHNPGILGPLIKIKSQLKIPVLFDAEDFHRGEMMPGTPASMRVESLENECLPKLSKITAASPLIGAAYQSLYPNLEVHPINNAFPLSNLSVNHRDILKPLSLVWFSQVIGLDRGLQEFLDSLDSIKEINLEITLIGAISNDDRRAIEGGVTSQNHSIQFQKPIPEKELFSFLSEHDIGLALELPNPENRNLCRTNKLYSYPLAGCYMLISKTKAQVQFIEEFPKSGELIDLQNPLQIAEILRYYNNHREELTIKKQSAQDLARMTLNWEHESKRLLEVTQELLAS